MMTLTVQVENFKRIINERIAYDYIDAHTSANKVNVNKLKSLIFLMEHSNLPQEEKENYVIATMLVDIALDTHEQVEENDRINHPSKALTKQLSVLGGDYYSSLYYLLLSKFEHFSFVKYLATAIKEVNELKMDFYFHTSEEAREYLAMRKEIEKHIVMQVAKYVEVHDTDFLKSIELIFIIDLLNRERERYEIEKSFNYFKQETIIQYLTNHIDEIILDYKQQLHSLLKNTNSELLLQFDDLFNLLEDKELEFVEEG